MGEQNTKWLMDIKHYLERNKKHLCDTYSFFFHFGPWMGSKYILVVSTFGT